MCRGCHLLPTISQFTIREGRYTTFQTCNLTNVRVFGEGHKFSCYVSSVYQRVQQFLMSILTGLIEQIKNTRIYKYNVQHYVLTTLCLLHTCQRAWILISLVVMCIVCPLCLCLLCHGAIGHNALMFKHVLERTTTLQVQCIELKQI